MDSNQVARNVGQPFENVHRLPSLAASLYHAPHQHLALAILKHSKLVDRIDPRRG